MRIYKIKKINRRFLHVARNILFLLLRILLPLYQAVLDFHIYLQKYVQSDIESIVSTISTCYNLKLAPRIRPAERYFRRLRRSRTKHSLGRWYYRFNILVKTIVCHIVTFVRKLVLPSVITYWRKGAYSVKRVSKKIDIHRIHQVFLKVKSSFSVPRFLQRNIEKVRGITQKYQTPLIQFVRPHLDRITEYHLVRSAERSITHVFNKAFCAVQHPRETILALRTKAIHLLAILRAHYNADLNHQKHLRKREDKRRRYARYAYMTVVTVLVATFLGQSFKNYEGAWWSKGWQYRKAVTINYTGTTTLTDFQVSVPGASLGLTGLVSAGKLQSDCADVRFTDSSGKQLSYWVEETGDTDDLLDCGSNNYSVWVKVPKLEYGDNTIYFYYGNSEAESRSNGENTFVFFDDFTDASLESAKWTVASGSNNPTFSSGKMLVGSAVTVYSNRTFTDGSPSNGESSFLRSRSSISSTSYDSAWAFSNTTTNGKSNIYADDATGFSFDSGEGGSLTTTSANEGATSGAVVGTPTVSLFYTYEIQYQASQSEYHINDGFVDDETTNQPNEPMRVRFDSDTNHTLTVDWVVVRSYATTAPSTPSAGAEESQATVGSAPPVAYWPLTKDTFDAPTKSLADKANAADAGDPPVLHLTMDDGDIDEHSCPDGRSVAGVCDASGNGNHGTANGSMTDSDYVAGKIGPKALDFDGSNDYLNIPDSDILDVTEAVSVSAWINGTSWADADRKSVFIKGGAYYLTVTPAGKVAVYGYGKSPTGYHLSNATLSTGTWYNLALTIDSDGFKIYINGVIDKAIAATGSITASTSDAAVGAEPGGTSRFFNGKIDEVKIYNYARTPEQIKADYENTKAYFGGGSSNPSWIPAFAGMTGGPSASGSTGGSSVLSFDGVDDYLVVPENDTLDPKSSDFSVGVWVKSTATSGSQDIVDKRADSNNYSGFLVGLDSSGASAYIRDTSGNNVSIAKSGELRGDNTWHHLLLSVDRSGNGIMYVDGVSGTPTSVTGVSGDINSVGRLTIGNKSIDLTSSAWSYFSGSIAGVKIFDYALSANQVKSQYAAGIDGSGEGVSASLSSSGLTGGSSLSNGLVGHWTFDGDAQDSSGNDNDGTLNNFTSNDDPTSGMLSHSGLTGFTAANVVDNNVSTNAWHTDSSTAGAYMKIDLGSGNDKPYVKSRIYSSTAYNGIWDIQYSDDDSTYYTAVSNFNPDGTGWHEISWDYVGSHRYWRLYLTNTPGSGAWLNELEMYKAVYDEGARGQALHFDGSNDYVTVSDADELDNGANNFTLSAWINPGQQPTQAGRIVFKVNDGGSGIVGYNFGVNSSGQLTGYIATAGSAKTVTSSTATLEDGNWHHVLMTVDRNAGASGLSLYIDGVAESSYTTRQDISGVGSIANTASLAMGTDNYTWTDRYFNGAIDDVRIYNRALNATEVEELYLLGGEKIGGYEFTENAGVVAGDYSGYDHSLTSPNSDLLTSNTLDWEPGRYSSAAKLDGVDDYFKHPDNIGGLVGHWTFDELAEDSCSGGQDLCDRSGNNNHGTTTGTIPRGAGVEGRSSYFVESSNYYTVNDSSSLKPTSTVTVSAWVKPNDISWQQVLSKRYHTSNDPWNSYIMSSTGGGSSQWQFCIANGTPGSSACATDPKVMKVGVWQHLVGSYDGVNLRFYVDGKLVNTQPKTGNIGYSTDPLRIASSNGTSGQNFDGYIDDVRIYNRTLSDSEIQVLYNTFKLAPQASISVEAMVKPNTDGSSNAVGGVIASKGENYKLSAISNPSTGSGSRTSFSTDTITSQLGDTNIVDVFFYDTTKDTIDNSWRFDTTKSWYSETIDATYAACNPSSHDRCGTKYFPEKAYIFTVDNGTGTASHLYIYDAEENAMWMRFDNNYAALNALMMDYDFVRPGAIFALNGKIYLGSVGNSSYMGVHTLDFIANEAIVVSGSIGWSGKNKYNGTLGTRNDQLNNTQVDADFEIVNEVVNDVHAAVIDGKTYVAVATDGGVSVINETDGSVVNITADLGASYSYAKSVWLTTNNRLYFDIDSSNTNGGRSIYAIGRPSSTRTVVTSTASATDKLVTGYDCNVTTTDIQRFISDTTCAGGAARGKVAFVTEGTSTIDGTSNTIYVKSLGGVTAIHENQSTMANGSTKFFTKDYVSEEMVGDIRGMWPLYGTSGASISNNTYNIDDVSVKSSELTAKNANGTGMSYVDGVRGTAIDFDGTDDYLCTDTNDDGTCDDDSDLDIAGTAFSEGAWIKTTDTSAWVISKYNGGVSGAYGLTINSGNARAHVEAPPYTVDSNTVVNDGEWHHIVHTFDGSNSRIYVDGELKNTQAISGSVPDTSASFAIGADFTTGSPTNFFDGTIDEPFVTAETLTADQVKHMYEVGKRALLADGESKLNGTSNQVNAVGVSGAYHYLDSGSGSGMTSSTLFAGTEGGGVSVIDLSSDTLTKAYTDTSTPAITHNNINAIWPSSGGGFVVGTDDGFTRLNDVSGIMDMRTDAYTHVAGVHDAGSGYLKLYENGVLVGRTKVGVGAKPVTNSSPLVVGGVVPGLWSADNSSAIAVNNFYGSIDGANVYNYAMSARDVNLNYGNGVGVPVLDMSFDEGQGVQARNRSWQKVGETTNLMPNPSIEVDTSSLIGYESTPISRVSSESFSGGYSLQADVTNSQWDGWKVTSVMSASANTKYTTSAWVKPASNGVGKSLRWWTYDQSSNYITESANVTLKSGWQRVSFTFSTQSGDTGIQVALLTPTGWSGGAFTFYTDGIQVQQGENITPYCDGSLTGSGTYSWNGTAHASTSTCTYGADGDVYGATWVQDGAQGRALRFDGTDDYVQSTYKPMNFDMDSSFTLSTWIKTQETSDARIIGSIDASDSFKGYVLQHMANGTLKLQIINTWFTNAIDVQTSDTVNDNKWHHIVATYDGSLSASGAKVFIDGIPAVLSTNYNSLSNSIRNNIGIQIGQAEGNFFDGDIDEPMVFPYALSSSEVKKLYNFNKGLRLGGATGGDQSSSSSRSSNSGASSLSDGLVGHWKMDEGVGTTSTDSSGNGNNVVFGGGAASPTWMGAKYGYGLDFDGGDYAEVADHDSLDFGTSSDFTVAFWANPDSASNASYVRKGFASSGTGYAIDSGSGSPVFGVGANGALQTVTATSALTNNVWSLVVGTVKRDEGKIRLFINGSLNNSADLAGNEDGTGSSTLRIGNNNPGSGPFDGSIDDVRIYNRALDAREIRDLYYTGPGPVGYWDFDENNGTVAKDTGTGANNGVLTPPAGGGPTWVPGVKGSALSFDGSDDYVNSGNVVESSYGTIGMWFNPSSVINSGSGRSGLLFNDKTSGTPSIILAFNADETTGKLQFAVNNGSGWYRVRSTATTWNAGEWHYVSASWGSGGLKIYIDGVLNDTNASVVSPVTETGDWTIGTDNNYFNGQIDEVKIYNYALSPYQIAKEFNGGAPVAHYAFDEGSGQSVHNTGGINKTRLNSHDSTFDGYLGSSATTTTSDPTWVTYESSCKKGKCLDFDEGDYVPTTGTVAGTDEDFTLSAWFNADSWSSAGCGPDQIVTTGTFLFGADGGGFTFNVKNTSWVWSQSGVSTTQPATGSWHHAVAIRQNNYLKLYVDGQFIGTSSGNDHGYAIGSVNIGYNHCSGSDTFDGKIDEVRLFNYALSPEDVAREYNQGAAVKFR